MTSSASSLLAKYTTLTSSIESNRKAIQNAELELEALQAQHEALIDSNNQMNQELQVAREETRELSYAQSKASREANQLRDVKRHQQESILEIENLKRQLQLIQRQRRDERNKFLRYCSNFRNDLKRNRIELANESQVIVSDSEDDDLIKAKNDRDASIQALENATDSHAETRDKRHRLEKEKNDREANLNQQKKQLEKLRRDIDKQNGELNDLQNSTVECEQMANAYQRDAKRRRLEQQQSGRTPYRQTQFMTPLHQSNTSVGTTPRSNTISNPYRKDTTAVPIQNPYSRSEMQQQHPHRAGRIRVDRQFSTSVSIADFGNTANQNSDTAENDQGRENNASSQTSRNDAVAMNHPMSFDRISSISIGNFESDCDNDDSSSSASDDILQFAPFEH